MRVESKEFPAGPGRADGTGRALKPIWPDRKALLASFERAARRVAVAPRSEATSEPAPPPALAIPPRLPGPVQRLLRKLRDYARALRNLGRLANQVAALADAERRLNHSVSGLQAEVERLRRLVAEGPPGHGNAARISALKALPTQVASGGLADHTPVPAGPRQDAAG